MKTVFIISFLLTGVCLFAQDYPNHTNENGRQGAWKIFLDPSHKIVSTQDSASIIRIISYKNDKPEGIVYDYFINGKLYREFSLLTDRPKDILHGKVVEYSEYDADTYIEFYDKGRINYYETIRQLEEIEPKGKSVLNSLGWAYLSIRNKDKANMYYEILANQVKKDGGDMSLEYAIVIKNWAWVYTWHDEFNTAEKLLFQAKQIIDQNREENILLYGEILNNIGDYYTYIGRIDEAVKYLTEAGVIFENNTEPHDSRRFVVLNNLAACYRQNGDYEKSVELLEKTFDNFSKIYGILNRETANVLNHLGLSYTLLGQTDKGLQLLKESVDIYEKLFNSNHKEFLEKKYFLGTSYSQAGKLEEALKIYTEVYDVYAEQYGEKNENSIRFGRSKAFILYRLGRKDEAIPIIRKTALQRQDNLYEFFDYLSEDARESVYRNQTRNFIPFQISLAVAERDYYPQLISDILNLQLRNKAMLLSATNSIKKRILESNDRKLIELYNELLEMKQMLGKIKDLSNEDIKESYGVDRDSLTEVYEIKDRELNTLSSIYASSKKVPKWIDIQANLQKGEALVEIISYKEYDFPKWNFTDSTRYLAIIVTAKTKDQPILVKIDNGNFLESKGISYYSNSLKHKIEDAKSYELFWQPIAKSLKGINKVYFSPDGVYHKINLQTLVNPKSKQYLMDEIDLHLITSGRDLLEEPRKELPIKLGMLIGNPAFGELPEGAESRNRYVELIGSDNSRGGVTPLPGAEREVKEISKLMGENGWKTITLTNDEANELAIKDMLRPNVLHIATHGYFQDENTSKGIDPLFRSGLLFTGATKTLIADPTNIENNEDAEDGILTAFEAMNLNIDNTSLVVLSACETGLGELKNGEGVYGLQRAFKIAGARTIIMSLWKVDDNATNKLMTTFYQNWLVENMSKREAFIKAQVTIRSEFSHPYYWGAFQLIGE